MRTSHGESIDPKGTRYECGGVIYLADRLIMDSRTNPEYPESGSAVGAIWHTNYSALEDLLKDNLRLEDGQSVDDKAIHVAALEEMRDGMEPEKWFRSLAYSQYKSLVSLPVREIDPISD